MSYIKHCFFILFFISIAVAGIGQELEPESDTLILLEEEVPTIELNPNAIDKKEFKKKNKSKGKEKKEPKRKKNEFYGIFSKKIFLKQEKGRNVITETFYVLPSYQNPSKYVFNKYYFESNSKKRRIIKTFYSHPKYGMPLHGSYVRRVNGDIVEEGYYYKGTKHGRWMKYGIDKDGDKLVLINKEKWDRGNPKGSRVTYYDAKKKYTKEVMPYSFGKLEGRYVKFYKNGRMMEMGFYQNGHKVGRWKEFYDRDKGNGKKIIDYPKNYWEEGEPIVVKEW
jgi:antitoxin component YwqK of YwqJK toxin-antitoxin module